MRFWNFGIAVSMSCFMAAVQTVAEPSPVVVLGASHPSSSLRALGNAALPARALGVSTSLAMSEAAGSQPWYGPIGNPSAAEAKLKKVYDLISAYRIAHGGDYPTSAIVLFKDLSNNPQRYGFLSAQEAVQPLVNADMQFYDPKVSPESAKHFISYQIFAQRPDGTPVGGAKPVGTRDVLAVTHIYTRRGIIALSPQSAPGSQTSNPAGFYLVLWSDGRVERIPYDLVLQAQDLESPSTFFVTFPSQAGNLVDSQDYAEFNAWRPIVPIGKPIAAGRQVPLIDNGGPESLVTFSRLHSFPSRYGIDREELWKNFDPAQEEFTLADVQAGAAKLKMPLELKTLTLDELQKLQAPAIFLTSDDKRIATLSQLDDKEAIVIDRGLTRIVPRDLLALRYGGQALVAASALAPQTNAPQVLAEDAVRQLSLASPEQVVTQAVKISNTGSAPLSLQIERPIPGCEKAELSASTVAPGQSATLSLSLRWRTVLKSPTQNVLVFLATNDPKRPRLPLGFKLSLPATTPAVTP